MYICIFVENMNDGIITKLVKFKTVESIKEANDYFRIERYGKGHYPDFDEIEYFKENESIPRRALWEWEWRRKNNGYLYFLSQKINLTDDQIELYNNTFDYSEDYENDCFGYVYENCELDPFIFNGYKDVEQIISDSLDMED